MKTLFTLGFGLLALLPARAQIFGPQASNGVLLGGIAGAVIGHNSGSLSHNGWQGAAIGAGVGALLGAAADSRAGQGDYVYRNGGYGGYDGYGGSAAYDGLWLGALAGGIIGRNSGGDWRHNGWRGAAWGAGAGWLLGSIVDANYGYYGYGYPRRVVTTVAQPAMPAAPAPQPVTIINNNYYGNASPMAGANSLFGR
jgi:hypothetical protein